MMIILHYQVIQDPKKCINNTIREIYKLSKPQDIPALQNELNTQEGAARPTLQKEPTPKESKLIQTNRVSQDGGEDTFGSCIT